MVAWQRACIDFQLHPETALKFQFMVNYVKLGETIAANCQDGKQFLLNHEATFEKKFDELISQG